LERLVKSAIGGLLTAKDAGYLKTRRAGKRLLVERASFDAWLERRVIVSLRWESRAVEIVLDEIGAAFGEDALKPDLREVLERTRTRSFTSTASSA
jgi:hypothetical protein